MADKGQVSGMDTRQKIVAVIVAIVVLIIIYNVWGLFSGGGSTPRPVTPTQTATTTPSTMQAPVVQTPKPTQTDQVPQQAALTPEDQALMKLQVEAEARYIQALNNLQILRIHANIAETNKNIAADKFATVTSEKKIVDLLSGPAQPPANYGQQLSQQPVEPQPAPAPPQQILTPDVPYTVVSITETHDVWSAVIGSSGTLYHVKVGDILPPDGSKVIEISRTSVTLQKDGNRRKVSLVSII